MAGDKVRELHGEETKMYGDEKGLHKEEKLLYSEEKSHQGEMKPPARQLAVITGASRGIGRAIAYRFYQAGYALVLNARDEGALRVLCAELSEKTSETGDCGTQSAENPACCRYVAGDISEPETARRLMEAADSFSKELGLLHSIDVLINNAGIAHIGLLQDMDEAAWSRIIGTDLTGVFHTCRAAVPMMLQAHSGRILNISSVWGVVGASCEVAYSAAKGGINAFTAALAKELAPSGIAVNALACGAVDTEMNAQLSEEEKAQLCEEIPAGRMADPVEVADFCLQLCRASTYLTGQTIRFDGGWI